MDQCLQETQARKRLKGGARDKLAGRRRCSTSVRGIVSYEQLFSFCFAAFHHGGSGSVAEAIRAGIPQIILPTVFDQQHWAERMQWLSVAKILSRTEQSKSTNIDENELFMAFEFLNSAEARENARNLRETIRGNESNGVNDTAELLESFAETKSSRRSNPSVTVRLKKWVAIRLQSPSTRRSDVSLR